jgi:hypothetical protein
MCVVRWRSLSWADHWYREVLPSVVCLRVIVNPRKWGGPGPPGAVAPLKKIYKFVPMLNSAAGHVKHVAPRILYLGTRLAPQPVQWPYAAESLIRSQRIFRYLANYLRFNENDVHYLIHNSPQLDSKFSYYFLNIHRNMKFPFTSRSSRQSPYVSSPKPPFMSLLPHKNHKPPPILYLFIWTYG